MSYIIMKAADVRARAESGLANIRKARADRKSTLIAAERERLQKMSALRRFFLDARLDASDDVIWRDMTAGIQGCGTMLSVAYLGDKASDRLHRLLHLAELCPDGDIQVDGKDAVALNGWSMEEDEA